MNPTVRLILRALVVGATTFGVQLQQSTVWDSALLRAAIVAAILAGLEALTPLNAVVGPGKTETTVPVGTKAIAPVKEA